MRRSSRSRIHLSSTGSPSIAMEFATWRGIASQAAAALLTEPEDAGTARNVLVLEAAGDQLRFSVNGALLWTGPRADLATDGVFGLRVNHGLNLHGTTIGRGS